MSHVPQKHVFYVHRSEVPKNEIRYTHARTNGDYNFVIMVPPNSSLSSVREKKDWRDVFLRQTQLV